MKKILTASLIIATFLGLTSFFTSCNKIKDAVAQNVPDITYEDDKPIITIPASSNTAPQSSLDNITFDLNDYVKNNAGGSGIDYSYVKHVYIQSINATIINGDANNNFNNFVYTSTSNPIIAFNTTPDYATATQIGSYTTKPTDPYNVTFPVSNNTDILSHINGKNWVYLYAYQLSKPTTKAMQIKLDVKYTLAFK
jgi:hypothetical protein